METFCASPGPGVRNLAAQERTRESERDQANDQAAKEQQQNLVEAAAAAQLRRRRVQKHQRTEQPLHHRGPPDQMKNDRQRDGEAAEQE